MVHGELKIQSFTSYHIYIKYITYKMFHTKAYILYTLYSYLIMITASFEVCLQWNKKKTKWIYPTTFTTALLPILMKELVNKHIYPPCHVLYLQLIQRINQPITEKKFGNFISVK